MIPAQRAMVVQENDNDHRCKRKKLRRENLLTVESRYVFYIKCSILFLLQVHRDFYFYFMYRSIHEILLFKNNKSPLWFVISTTGSPVLQDWLEDDLDLKKYIQHF